METVRRSIKIPDNLWNQIPTDNKSEYIRDAIQAYIHKTHDSHTDNNPTIQALEQQIDELKRDKEYFRYFALPFWKRWMLRKRLPPPKTEE